MNYIDQIKEYKAQNEIEENEKRVIEDYIRQFPHNILSRENEFAHITSSGFIMNPGLDKVLMIHHNVYHTWTWTGGHADRDTDLLEIALKEAREETGVVNIKPLSTTIASLDIIPVWGHFKRGKYVCAHLHLNSAYILIAEETEALILNKEETSGVRWISTNELEKYSNEPYVLSIYNNLITKANLLSSKASPK